MSAGGPFVLLISGRSIAVYVMSSGTAAHMSVPDQGQQEDRASNPTSSSKLVVSRSEEPSSSFTKPTVVTVVERPVEHSVALGQSLAPRGPDSIGRELQKALKRVGCYAGELDGVWTTPTRQAMNTFADRVNAKLPTNTPDSILLALVRGYSLKVCAIPCPSGQSLSRAQECTPNGPLVRTNGTKLPAAPGQAKETSARIAKTTAAGGVSVPPAGIEHAGNAAPVGTPSSSRPLVKKHWQPPVRQEGSWAATFYQQRDRLSLN